MQTPTLALTLTLSLALTACAPTPPPTTAPPPPATQTHFPPDEDLRTMLRYLVEDGAAPGIVLGVIEADGTTRVLSYGTAGPGTRPLGPRTVFEIGSINKTFTGTILADMVARGEVALDDPVAKYLPAGVTVPSRGGRQITLLDLATHRSGLPRLPDNFAPADPTNPYVDYAPERLYAFLSAHQLRRDIGAEFEYSNLGMGLLGHALARAAGTDVATLVRQRVLEPLGMEMTSYAREDVAAWLAKGHDAEGNVVSYWDLSEAVGGAGGLRSNMEDMLVYLRANLGEPRTDLERAMRVAHREHHRYEDDFAMGLGWAVREHEGRALRVHGGGTGGFRTSTGFDPEKGVGFVLLTNSGAFPDDLGDDLLRRGLPLSLPEVEVAPEVLRAYVGEYEMGPGRSAFVRLEDDGAMTLRVPNNVRFRMHADSDTSFFMKRAPWRVRFQRDDSGAVTGLVLNTDGPDRPARRISDRAPLPGEEVRDLPLSAAEMARYVGTFALRMGEQTLNVRVFVEDGRLMAHPAGQRPSALRHQGSHTFVPAVDPGIRLVFTVVDGRAESVVLHQGGNEVPGTRVP